MKLKKIFSGLHDETKEPQDRMFVQSISYEANAEKHDLLIHIQILLKRFFASFSIPSLATYSAIYITGQASIRSSFRCFSLFPL